MSVDPASASTGTAAGLALFPARASTVAGSIDAIYLTWLGIMALVLAGIYGVILWFLIKYRKGSPAPRGSVTAASTRLEILWTVAPFLISLVVVVWAARVYLAMATPPPHAEEVYVVAKQWMWKFQHRGGQREIDELHVPLGQPIKLLMTSQDVIHSFFVPAFRIKQDLLPGRYTHAWFQATAPGEYRLFCAQYCGTRHAAMIGKIVVLRAEDYARWLEDEPAGTGRRDHDGLNLASEGRQLFTRSGCAGCHSGAADAQGPSLEGIFGRPQTLNDDTTVLVDEAYVRESILRPGARIVHGYPNVMPSFEGLLNEEQVLALVEFVKSLAQTPPKGNAP